MKVAAFMPANLHGCFLCSIRLWFNYDPLYRSDLHDPFQQP